MANTYTLIQTQTLASSAASVTFSSIPATFTDLVLRISARYDGSLVHGSIEMRPNSDSGSNYSQTTLYGTGSAAVSANGSAQSSAIFQRQIVGDTATANTFSNSEIYIPNYLSSDKKPMSGFGVGENNATLASLAVSANLWQGTAAITSIFLQSNGTNWLSGSSFYLYGIKNS